MPKGFWIANSVVTDAEEYEKYKAANANPFGRYGARFLVRAGVQQIREGEAFPRTVVLEFPSMEAAIACYDDPEYQAAKGIRDSVSDTRMIIVEGYDG